MSRQAKDPGGSHLLLRLLSICGRSCIAWWPLCEPRQVTIFLTLGIQLFAYPSSMLIVCISWIAVPIQHHHGQAQLHSIYRLPADLPATNSPNSDDLVANPFIDPMMIFFHKVPRCAGLE